VVFVYSQLSSGSIQPPLLEPAIPTVGIRANLRGYFFTGLEAQSYRNSMEGDRLHVGRPPLFKG